MTSACAIRVDGVSKSFVKDGRPPQVVHALQDINMCLPHGSFSVFIGPSGCGKSTVMNMIAGVLRPTTGTVTHEDVVVDGINRNVGYITQTDTTLPWRTVLKNVLMPLEVRNVSKTVRESNARAMLKTVGLSGFEDHYPGQLSGGMRRRLALAVALVYEPDTLLLDEPFGALDAQTKTVMQEELLRVWRQTGKKTFVFVTHDLDEAVLMADEIFVFSRGPGRIVMRRQVDLPRPRDAAKVRADPEAISLRDELWSSLREQIQETSMADRAPQRARVVESA